MVSALARISADCVWPCLDVYPGPAALFARFESLIEGRLGGGSQVRVRK
jgi:hypothetical protein